MRVFISGTDTNVGKTVICSWLCIHTGYDYFKPIQTGNIEGRDSDTVASLTSSTVHDEIYDFSHISAPYLAATKANQKITLSNMKMPSIDKLIIEGAGGLLVPINEEVMMIDLIRHFSVPVILVSSTRLGTINHTLLSLEALKSRNINIVGVIMNGEHNSDNSLAIEYYGKIKVLAEVPKLSKVNYQNLKSVPLTPILYEILSL